MKTDPIQNRKPASAAAYWFNRHRAGAMSADDMRAFEVWMRRDVEHNAAYRKLESAWSHLSTLEDDPTIMDARDAYESTLADRRGRRTGLAIAASLMLAAAGGWALNAPGLLSEFNIFQPAPAQEFRTSIGQQTTIKLLDNSVVTLDTDTVLRTRFSRWERRIELERGQAFFQVAKDKSRPFIVAAADKTVRATGTQFDVRTEPGRFEVTLIEGRVLVQQQGAKRDASPGADMRPGWRLAVGEDARWRMEPVDLNRVTSWHDGMLVFYDAPISNAVAEMNRYSRRKIVLRGALPNTYVLGNFHAGDVEQFVHALESNRIARMVSQNEDHIEISAR